MTLDLVLQMPNPEYNQVSRARLDKMLRHPRLREYAVGLYLKEEPKEGEMELGEVEEEKVKWLE